MIPKVRESNFGQTLGERSKIKNYYGVGPSDLLHRAIYAGSKSALYNQYDFRNISKTDTNDGYVGYYHYINGLIDIDKHIRDTMEGQKFKKDIIITYCTWNIFSRTDHRIKFVLHPNGTFDKQIITKDGINEEELKVSQIIRLLYYIDSPQHQLVGTINFPIFNDKEELKSILKLLTSFINKGQLTGDSRYRNKLIDGVMKLCKSKELSRYVCSLTDFDYLKARLLQSQDSIEYLTFVQKFTGFSSSNGMILLDEVKYLIKHEHFDLALEISKKTITLQPLDFECWYHLAICYILTSNFVMAMSVINQFPIKFKQDEIPNDIFINTYLSRINENETISEKTFNETFPEPKTAKMKKWNHLFLFNSYLRHPIVGYFHQSPLFNSSQKQLASTTLKHYQLHDDQYGKLYDLLTFFVALYGWDQIIKIKEDINCEIWLEQLFLNIYQDLKTCLTNKNCERSALEWNLIGNLGYQVKFNLKESINSLITSVLGSEFDYFGVSKLLQIYNDLILKEQGLNSLILKYNKITNANLNLDLDFILLQLMIFVSWQVRWYNYVQNTITVDILYGLISKYDAVYLLTRFKIIYENNKLKHFDKSDTVYEYIESLIHAIDNTYS